MLFLILNEQCQSTEGNCQKVYEVIPINLLNISWCSTTCSLFILCMYGCIERLLSRDCKALGDHVYTEPEPWPVSVDFRLIYFFCFQILLTLLTTICLQCFDAVGWSAGRASGTHTNSCFMAFWILSRTTWVSRYQKKHSPARTCRSHQSSLICFLHLLRFMASSLFNLRAWQSFCTISVQVFFVLPLGLAPCASYNHTPYISSPNHCLLFAPHDHTIAACFAVFNYY